MEFYQLLGFYETAKLGSVSKAAKIMFRTQSALSQQVKALERELGCRLFERIGKQKMRLTYAGERLFSFTGNLIQQRNELVEDLNQITGQKAGRLRIGGQFASFYYLLPDIISTYRKQYPEISLKLFERPFREIISLLQSGDIDFGIFMQEPLSKDLVAIHWKKTELILATPKRHPLTKKKRLSLEMIASYPLILPSKSLNVRTGSIIEDEFRKQKIKYEIVMEASTFELASKYVEMGIGIAFVPSGFGIITENKRDLDFIAVGHLFETDFISIILRKDMMFQSHKRAFIDLVLQTA